MLVLILILFIALFFSVLRGLTLDVFWDWFISGPSAPFHSVPSITFVQALGLSLLISFLTFQPGAEKDDSDKDPTEVCIKLISTGFLFYGVFWVFAIIYHGLAS